MHHQVNSGCSLQLPHETDSVRDELRRRKDKRRKFEEKRNKHRVTEIHEDGR